MYCHLKWAKFQVDISMGSGRKIDNRCNNCKKKEVVTKKRVSRARERLSQRATNTHTIKEKHEFFIFSKSCDEFDSVL